MLTLFHHPLCPRSRYVRLIFGEYGIATRLVEERFWERREEFLLLNPAGELPVVVTEGQPPIPGAAVIAEYIEETHPQSGQDRLLPDLAGRRVEARRLAPPTNGPSRLPGRSPSGIPVARISVTVPPDRTNGRLWPAFAKRKRPDDGSMTP